MICLALTSPSILRYNLRFQANFRKKSLELLDHIKDIIFFSFTIESLTTFNLSYTNKFVTWQTQ